MKTCSRFFAVLAFVFLLSCTSSEQGKAGEVVPGLPVKDTVTMVDLGAKTCVPCKLMAPILEELKREYKGRAEVIFIDVWDEANKGKAQKFRIAAIPTQVFYNKQGEEVFRHTGFSDREAIIEKLEELLAL